MFATVQALREVILYLALRDLECLRWDDDKRNKSSAGNVLAVSAMTFAHHDWFRTAFVANRPRKRIRRRKA
jgi:hypothetical protein